MGGLLKSLMAKARALASAPSLPPLMHREPIRGSRRRGWTLPYRPKPVEQKYRPFEPHGRYDGTALRLIRSEGQARECARRLKRRASC